MVFFNGKVRTLPGPLFLNLRPFRKWLAAMDIHAEFDYVLWATAQNTVWLCVMGHCTEVCSAPCA
jgi:hypothetical protein